MELLAAERGIRFILGQAVGTPHRVREYLDDFRDRGVDAIISIFHNHPDFRDTVLPELARFPNVIYYEKPDHADEATVAETWYVEPDYYRVGELGVQYLLNRGRERIALVLNNRAFSYARHRYRAYVETLRAAGHDERQQRVWIMDEQPGVRWTDPFTEALALAAVDELVVRKGADGLVAVNDLYAARLMRALHRRGRRVPDDVAVIGCDNLEFAPLLEPPLTTLDLAGADPGLAAAEAAYRQSHRRLLWRRRLLPVTGIADAGTLRSLGLTVPEAASPIFPSILPGRMPTDGGASMQQQDILKVLFEVLAAKNQPAPTTTAPAPAAGGKAAAGRNWSDRLPRP